MILDRLENLSLYADLNPRFDDVLDFLEDLDLRTLDEGRHEIDGDRVFVVIARSKGKGRRHALLESHRKYIDIQVTLQGHEEIGWMGVDQCRFVREAYDEDKDIQFFADESIAWLDLYADTFAIFLPTDAHAPLAGRGEVLKAVFKVAVD